MQYFNEGLIDDKSDGDHIENNPHYNGFNTLEEHNILCMNGIARNSLRCGEIKKGVKFTILLYLNTVVFK